MLELDKDIMQTCCRPLTGAHMALQAQRGAVLQLYNFTCAIVLQTKN